MPDFMGFGMRDKILCLPWLSGGLPISQTLIAMGSSGPLDNQATRASTILRLLFYSGGPLTEKLSPTDDELCRFATAMCCACFVSRRSALREEPRLRMAAAPGILAQILPNPFLGITHKLSLSIQPRPRERPTDSGGVFAIVSLALAGHGNEGGEFWAFPTES